MEELILVDRAQAQSDTDGRDTKARASLARFARVHSHGGWRDEVARLAGAPELVRAGAAEIARYSISDAASDAASDAPGAPRAACFASPVYVQIGRYGGRLHRDSFLALSRAEAAELIECFDADPPAANVSLHALTDGSLLALIPPIPATRTAAPENALDQSIDAVLPEGEGAAALRRLSTELEIWLYALPLNRTRVQEGSPPITTLWLWGCGARPEHLPQQSQLHIASGDAYLCGMAQLLGATRLDASGTTVEDLLARGAARAIADIPSGANGADGVNAAIAAVRVGRIKRLIVIGTQTASTLQRRDFFKIWRRARPSS